MYMYIADLKFIYLFSTYVYNYIFKIDKLIFCLLVCICSLVRESEVQRKTLRLSRLS